MGLLLKCYMEFFGSVIALSAPEFVQFLKSISLLKVPLCLCIVFLILCSCMLCSFVAHWPCLRWLFWILYQKFIVLHFFRVSNWHFVPLVLSCFPLYSDPVALCWYLHNGRCRHFYSVQLALTEIAFASQIIQRFWEGQLAGSTGGLAVGFIELAVLVPGSVGRRAWYLIPEGRPRACVCRGQHKV